MQSKTHINRPVIRFAASLLNLEQLIHDWKKARTRWELASLSTENPRETWLRPQRNRGYTRNQKQTQHRECNIWIRGKLMSLIKQIKYCESSRVDVSRPDKQQDMPACLASLNP